MIQSGDHKGRTCVVKWIKLNPSSDDVEVSKKTGQKCDTTKYADACAGIKSDNMFGSITRSILLHIIDDV